VNNLYLGPFVRLKEIFKDRVLRNSLFGGIGVLIPLLTTLIFTPFLVKRMGIEGYGLWSISISALGLMGVLEFGLAKAVEKYIAEYRSTGDSDGIPAVMSIGLIFNIVVGIILTIPIYLASAKIAQLFQSDHLSQDQVSFAIRLTAFGFLPMLVRNTTLAIPRGLQHFELPMYTAALQNVLTSLTALIFSSLGASVGMVVFSTVIIMWLSALGSSIMALRQLASIGVAIRFRWSSLYFRKMLSFMVFTGLGGIGRQLFTFADRIVVGAVLGLSQAGYYTVTIGIARRYIVFAGEFTRALMPAASSWYASGDIRKLKQYFRKSTLFVAILNLVVLGVLLAISSPFLRLWMGVEFAAHALQPLRILILIFAVMSITSPAMQMMYGVGKPWINTLVDILSGVGTIWLIPILSSRYGLAGAAWANVVSWIKYLVIIELIFLLSREKTKATIPVVS
jgi:O-antigen/teichoic acid export membrane protein